MGGTGLRSSLEKVAEKVKVKVATRAEQLQGAIGSRETKAKD
jgi:hypothetical protein